MNGNQNNSTTAGLKSGLEFYALKLAYRAAAAAFGNLSNRSIAALAALAGKINKAPQTVKAIEGFRQAALSNSPNIELARRIFREINPRSRRGLIDNLVINGLLKNQGKKAEAYKNHQTVPTAILISPTMRCNLRCQGCYAANYSKADDLPPEVFDRIIREGKDLGVSFFTILGGEPFLYRDLLKTINRHSDAYFQIYTNGTLINEKLADEIARAGNIMPTISIEGWAEQTDQRRGKGMFENIESAMKILRSRKIPFGFSAAVTRKNEEIVSSDEFIDEMISRGALIGWFFLYMPVGREPDLSLMPTPEQRRHLLERDRHIRDAKPLFIVDFWNDAPFVGGCIAGREYIHITSKGDVEPCIFTHFAVDNIKNKSLKEVMESEYFRDLRSRQPYGENLYRPCMWIDHPEVSREIFNKHGAYPTHGGADDVLAKPNLKSGLDNYSAKVAEIYDPLWREEKSGK